jgi:flagellar biogenesis protein FliO
MTKARFDGIVAIGTVALAFAVARLLPFQDSATRAFIALAFALAGVLLGNWIWRRTVRRRSRSAREIA